VTTTPNTVTDILVRKRVPPRWVECTPYDCAAYTPRRGRSTDPLTQTSGCHRVRRLVVRQTANGARLDIRIGEFVEVVEDLLNLSLLE
jgi:hypothetical protein